MRFYDIQVLINNIDEIPIYISNLLVLKAKAETRDAELFYTSIITELNDWQAYWKKEEKS